MVNLSKYKILWIEEALDDLKNITHKTALKIDEKINSYLAQSPKELGKPLTGKYQGLYRYRYGDYRIIYEIDLENNAIVINRIGHRSAIYKKI